MDGLNIDGVLELVEAITQRRPRGTTPSAQPIVRPTPAPVPQPEIQQLPSTGVGMGAGPRPPAQPIRSPGDALGAATSGALGFLGDKLGGGFGAVAQSGPITALGSTGAAQMLGTGISTALSAPQGVLLEDFGADAYRYVADPNYTKSALGGAVIQENMPVLRGLFQWARENPEKVKAAYEQGFTDRTGDQRWVGGRAVWEAYSRERLTANAEGVLTSILTDPYNLIPGIGRAGGSIRAAGANLARNATDDAVRTALREASQGGVTRGDELAAAAMQDLQSGHPFRIQDVLDTISPELGTQWAAGNVRLSSFPNGLEGLARAAAYQVAARGATPDAGLQRLGRALEVGGTAIELPARFLDEIPSRAVGGTARAVNTALGAIPIVGPAKSRVGATVGRWFSENKRAQALQAYNATLASRGMRNEALRRQRELQAMVGPEIANIILGPEVPPGIEVPAGAPPPPTFADLEVQQTTLGGSTVPATTPATNPLPVIRADELVDEGPPGSGPRIPGLYIRDDSTPTTPKFQIVDGDTEQVVTAIDFPSVEEAQEFIARRGARPAVERSELAADAATSTSAPEAATATLTRPAEAAEPDVSPAAPTSRLEGELGQDIPAAVYREEIPTGPSSIERARQRYETRFGELAAPADENVRAEIQEIIDNTRRTRDSILETSGQGDRYRDAVNRVDLWIAEFEAEQQIRYILGDAAPPHVNREAGKLAQDLDRLAWAPDETEAAAARQRLLEMAESSDPQMVAPAIRDAIETAEENRSNLPQGRSEFATPPIQETTTVRDTTRQIAPTPELAAREEMTLPPAANGTVEVPIEQIRTDPARFQPREGISQNKVNNIAENFDWQKINADPLTLWRDPVDGNIYLVAGHHRLEGMKKRGDITHAPAVFIEGDEDYATSFARASNDQRPESPLEKAATVRWEFDRFVESRGIDPTGTDERDILKQISMSNVDTVAEKQKLLNLSRLPGTIRDNLAVHANAGKSVIDAHAKLGSRIDPHAKPRNGIQTVTPQEAESLYRTLQKQKRKKPDDALPDLTREEIDRVVDSIDAMTGMNRVDQMGMFAGMTTDDGRAAEFLAATAEMVKRHKLLQSRQRTHEKSLSILERDIADLEAEAAAAAETAAPTPTDMFGEAVPTENPRLREKIEAYNAMRREVEEARAALQDAQQQGLRLTENAKRADDYTEWQLGAIFGPTPADIERAVRAGGEIARRAWDWSDEALANRRAADAESARITASLNDELERSRGVTLGPVVPEQVTQTLGRQFTENSPRFQGRSYGDVIDEIETRVVADKTRLIELLAEPTSTLEPKALREFNRLSKQYGITTRAQAAAMNPEAIAAREFREAVNEDFAVPTPTPVGRALDKLSVGYSALNLLMPWTLPRYFIGNMTGDTWQVLLNVGPEAAIAINDPRHIDNMIRYAVRGGDPLNGAVGDLVKRSGLGGYHRRLVTENLAEAMVSSEAKAVRRAGGRARFNWIGDAAASRRNPVNIARNVVNGMEWGHRTALWGFHYQTLVINAKPQFAREMSELALKNGISGDEVARVMDLLDPIVDGAEVADRFARLAGMRGRTVQEAAGFGEEMGRKWASKIYQANEDALNQVDDSLFSYAQTNADAVLRRVIPFHWWMSRAIPFYAEQMIRHPGFTAAYYGMYEATREQAESEGWPAALNMFTKAFELPGGMMLMLNPLATVGVLDTMVEQHGGYTDENVSAIGRVLNGAGQFGFGLLPWWGAALNHLGYLGDSPFGLDPIGLHQTRNLVGTIVQGVIGESGGGLAPKPYEQALRDVRDKLSSFGLPGSYHIQSSDPNAMPAVMIRNIMLRKVQESMGIDHNQYLALAAAAQADPASQDAMLFEEINDYIAADEMDNGPLYRASVQDYSRAQGGVTLANAFFPGPKRVRQEEALATQALSRALNAPVRENDPSNTVLGGGLPPVRALATGEGLDRSIEISVAADDAEFLRRWKEKFGADYQEGDLENLRQAVSQANQVQNAPPETAAILNQQNAYYALGSEKARERLDIRNAILGGRRGVRLAGDGIDLTAQEVSALGEDERRILADAWLELHDQDAQAANLREVRRLYEETHPEWGAYEQWQRDTRTQWGGARAFRLAAARTNPNYAEFIARETSRLRSEGKTPSQILEGLDAAALGLNAYLAYQGLRSSRYDPMPRETGVPLPVASEGAPIGALGGGGDAWQSWDDRVRTAIAETDRAVRVANEFAGQNILQIPAEWREAIFAMPGFPPEGIMPSDAWIYEDYFYWYHEQAAMGGDTSVEAFIESTRQQTGGVQPTVNYQPGVWPPVAVAS